MIESFLVRGQSLATRPSHCHTMAIATWIASGILRWWWARIRVARATTSSETLTITSPQSRKKFSKLATDGSLFCRIGITRHSALAICDDKSVPPGVFSTRSIQPTAASCSASLASTQSRRILDRGRASRPPGISFRGQLCGDLGASSGAFGHVANVLQHGLARSRRGVCDHFDSFDLGRQWFVEVDYAVLDVCGTIQGRAGVLVGAALVAALRDRNGRAPTRGAPTLRGKAPAPQGQAARSTESAR